MARRIVNTMAERTAAIGRVTTQDTKMPPTTRKSITARLRAKPTPTTAPTAIWVVETGMPVRDANTTVAAAARVAQNPRLGVSAVMRLPMVAAGSGRPVRTLRALMNS